MKYIRTKDTILTNEEYDEYFNAIEIISQAETIEELVDGFWWEDDFYKAPIFMPNHYFVLERVKSWKESDKELLTNEFARISIYASIYVKGKGWVHVAKMNDNGELELL